MKTRLIPLLLAVLTVFSATAARASEPLHVGIVPQFDLRRINLVWIPILNQLEQETGLRFQLEIPPSIPAFEQALNAGLYDLAYMNPYHFVLAHQRQGYQALIRDHAGTLSGIIVVAKDSPITTVAMLDGKTVAFPSPNSMGAALVPRAEFVRKFHIKVTETYVKSHSSVYLNVILGQADAGGGVQATFDLLDPEMRSKLRILYETNHFPPHPLAVHPRLPKGERELIQHAFLHMAQTEAGKALIAEIPMKQAGAATSDDYAGLARLGLEEFYVEQ